MNVAQLRQHASQIFEAGLRAVDPEKAIKQFVNREGEILQVGEKNYHLEDYRNIYIIGGGKAGASMSIAIEDILGDWISAGHVIVKYEHMLTTRTVILHEAGHPVPDGAGVQGTRQMIRLVESATDEDLVFCLISGGGSALMVAPAEGITLEDMQTITTSLLNCGATINEINTIRKHLSSIKGGQLARLAHPATLITLMLSDVIGDPLDVIASGPTVPDSQTFADCLDILNTYGLTDQVPEHALNRIRQGIDGILPDTPKVGDPIFDRTHNLVIASNRLAAESAACKAEQLGYHTMLLSTFVEGETRDVAKVHTAILKEIRQSGQPIPAPACILSGGETTVTIRGNGLGGRNQEFVLAAAIDMSGMNDVLVVSAGTDGTDGPTDAAGAIADGTTISRAGKENLNPIVYLKNNDSYHFFDALNDLIKTGPTHTNVMDLRIMLVGKTDA